MEIVIGQGSEPFSGGFSRENKKSHFLEPGLQARHGTGQLLGEDVPVRQVPASAVRGPPL